MDPNAELAFLRWLASEAQVSGDNEPWAKSFTALDNWLSNGGSLPADWSVIQEPS